MEKTTDSTIVESLKEQKKLHMLFINAQSVLLQPQCINKMDYLFLIILCLFIIYFLYIYYKLYKIWNDYINMDSGKNNRQGANVCIKSIDTDYPSTTVMFKTKKDNDY